MLDETNNPFVTYTQGMTRVWSDGEKIIIKNKSGIKWVKDNIEQIFGMGEWDKIVGVAYSEYEHPKKKDSRIRAYECVSGYIPSRVVEELAAIPEELSKEDERQAKLEALKDV
jgi:hypothetical protein